MTVNDLYKSLYKGDLQTVLDNRHILNNEIDLIINKQDLNNEEVNILEQIIRIGNIVYNNSELDDDLQPIENGVYDILLEKHKKYNPKFQVGAEPIVFKVSNNNISNENRVPMIRCVDKNRFDDMLYKEELTRSSDYTSNVPRRRMISFIQDDMSKVYRNTTHSNPELVGSLDKCKYVLNKQALDKGVFDDSNVKILERDFFEPHFKRGLINNNDIIRIMLELKYDGTSVVVSIVNGMVVKAETRGDTGTGKTTDVTSLLYGYMFPNLPKDISLDCKCEAIMTYDNLRKYNIARGKNYKNARSAINGLFTLLDGYLYQEFITLIPLKIAHSTIDNSNFDIDNIDRITEIEFMNKYLLKDEMLRHSYIEGQYIEVLYMIKRFVEEAEFIRPIMSFMYDGVVASYIDDDIIHALGRENSINKYSIAIKFNPDKKQTTFREYTFHVGQDGSITPMAHYDIVEFFGTIHNKSTLSSYHRFNTLGLKEGDIIDVTYENDVMPYVTKPDIDHNEFNPNPVIPFISHCPSCDSELELSTSGKSAKCPNISCPERNLKRMANMMDKLDIKDFAEASMEKLGKYTLRELLSIQEKDIIDILGEGNSKNFMDRMHVLKNEDIFDFIIVGALGFTGIAQSTWEKILKVYSVEELIYTYGTVPSEEFRRCLSAIKTIGPITAETICNEFEFFYNDLLVIMKMPNVKSSKGIIRKKIRFTGFRNKELIEELQQLGFDAGEGSVTKDTFILLVPTEGYTSSKVSKVSENTMVIPVQEFINNKSKYLQFSKQ